ncbi:Ig domain-containing protein [Streptomyces bambusae]|uniref:Ig domain-containing protein n=1 Tax=Streptomyces bambusae TaxID=1550616 RepID=UPI001CFF6A6C|nr:Ig domain-containing protein [Streptomyces bambusae]MCB5169702.1 Ig domain-containing protein [Streptomyces bambusae]
MAVVARRPLRIAALLTSLAAAVAVASGPSAAAAPAPSGGAGSVAASGAAVTSVAVANPGTQVHFQYDPVRLQMTASGGTGVYTWSAANLPGGLTINAFTGLISGTARGAGTRTVTVIATDSAGVAGSTAFTWRVIRDACPRC